MKFAILFIVLSLTVTSNADIVNVPDDQETIQGAIDASEDGDTVLVAPGEYVENISTAGKTNIVIGSLTLTTEDPAYIDSTIIDGGGEGVVVTIVGMVRNGSIVLRGFTIRNGNSNLGSGISASGVIYAEFQDLYITQNQGNRYGCVSTQSITDSHLQRVTISDNDDNGIYMSATRASLTDCEMSNNRGFGAFMGAGRLSLTRVAFLSNQQYGLKLFASGSLTFNNLTIAGTRMVEDADGIGLWLWAGANRVNVLLANSVIYGNEGSEIILQEGDGESSLNASFSDVEGGEDGIEFEGGGEPELIWGEGNIDADPLFADPDNGDYHLTEDSPCIDTGDPDSPEDPDGTRADMGAYYYPQRDPDDDGVLHVPDEYETIQEAIDDSEDGDSVLVAPGEYVENINFGGKAIVVIGNPDDPSEVIINGNEQSSVVRFDSGEDENSVLTGFTLTNGSGSEDIDGDLAGGGIHCRRSSPTLKHLIISGNNAAFGGGTFFQISSPVLSHSIVTANQAAVSGGGSYFSRDSTEAVVSYTLYSHNSAETFGGAICCYNSSNPIFDNLTVVDNSANAGGGLGSNNSNFMTISNSIFNGNDPQQIAIGAGGAANDTIQISYSDFDGGEEALSIGMDCTLNWNDGNIDEDPLFVDRDESDFHLSVDSPCIDAGDPDSPEDADRSRADMGAYPFTRFQSVVEGFVFDAVDDAPLPGVMVVNEFGLIAESDTLGYWYLRTLSDIQHDVTALGRNGYLDSTVTVEALELGDTVEVIFRLLHAVLIPSEDEFTEELPSGNSANYDFNIRNRGNGVLDWMVTSNTRDAPDPWTLHETNEVSDVVDDPRVKGVVFADDKYYVSGGGRSSVDDNFIYVLNRDGELEESYPQIGNSRYGMADLAWDGELIWGSIDYFVYGFEVDGDSVTSFETPSNYDQAVAWDSDRELLWIAGKLTDYILGYNREGVLIDSLEQLDFQIYGLSYFPDDPDGYTLYATHLVVVPDDGDYQEIHKINPETGEAVFVIAQYSEEREPIGKPEGICITDRWDPLNWVMLTIVNKASHDILDIWQVEGRSSWMRIEPESGSIDPQSQQELVLTLDATDLDSMTYPGELTFRHNGVGGETVIPIDLTVTPLGVEDNDDVLPTDFAITGVYPNPFNSSSTINYVLPQSQQVTVRIYDLAGRLVNTLYDDFQVAGSHSVMWDSQGFGSGVYLMRVETESDRNVAKLVLMK